MLNPVFLKIIALLLVAFAAICNALMDTHAHHWSSSVLKNWGRFWRQDSWLNKYVGDNPRNGFRKVFGKINLPVAFTDGWHLAKSSMVVALCAAIALGFARSFGEFTVFFIVLGLAWNLPFNLFYNHFLKGK